MNPNAKDLVGRWGLYPGREYSTELIHPEDREKYYSLPAGRMKVFYCSGVEGDYLLLQYGETVCRLKPENFQAIQSPKWSFGDTVTVCTKRKIKEGIIRHIVWHSKRQIHYYLIEINGKVRYRWFFEEDILIDKDKLI